MIKKILFLGLLMGWSWNSMAQNTTEPAAELSTTPPVIASAATRPDSAARTNAVAPLAKRKITFGLSAGTQFSRLWGTSTFLEPSIMFPVTNRFSGFASLSFVNTFGQYPLYTGVETTGAPGFMGTKRYILNAGGSYMVNERLNLTGQVWRDFSRSPAAAPVNVFNPGSASGVLMRAHYKVTENFSVSGGLRFSNGNYYHHLGYNPAAPFGY